MQRVHIAIFAKNKLLHLHSLVWRTKEFVQFIEKEIQLNIPIKYSLFYRICKSIYRHIFWSHILEIHSVKAMEFSVIMTSPNLIGHYKQNIQQKR